MKRHKYPQVKIGVMLATGALVALVLCVQCVRTYLYTDSVLVPQQAEREAQRQIGGLNSAARSAGITDPRALGPVIEHVLEAASGRLLWMRVLDPDSNLLAQGGAPLGMVKIPPQWWDRLDKHETVATLVQAPTGAAFVSMLPFRMSRPPHFAETKTAKPEAVFRASNGRRAGIYVVELAIPFSAVSGTFDGLRHNLIVGLIASVTLLVSLAAIGLRTPHYVRGKYLEGELQLARRVQSDLQPKSQSISPYVEFAASAIAADHVGGDFYDVFEAESGEIAIVLADVSGKGVPAALLVSVLQGAIRSSAASRHERACERINQMLCERSACERFATLFWGMFDPVHGTLRYVNAGHVSPILVRSSKQVERLREGGPVLGLLPHARYSAGTVELEDGDSLVLYSDGISEAEDRNYREFGEAPIEELVRNNTHAPAKETCERIMNSVAAFTKGLTPADDRTLVVVRFSGQGGAQIQTERGRVVEEAIA